MPAPAMNLWLLAAGLVVLAIAMLDALWTTLWVDGHAGPLTGRWVPLAWKGARALVGGHSRLLSAVGPLLLLLSVIVWMLLLWAGWLLLFMAQPDAVVDAQTGALAGIADRVYFTGYSVFTLGNGDFKPVGAGWQLASVLASATGMSFITLAVSYLLPVVEAVVKKRDFASQVTGLGLTPEELVITCWTGSDFSYIETRLVTFADQLSVTTEQHQAYPILHYYHSTHARKSPPFAVAVLDEALTLLEHGVAPEIRPGPAALRNLRSTVGGFIETLESVYVDAAEVPPPPPRLGLLRAAGIPTVGDAEFAAAVEALEKRRRVLRALVEGERWEWPNSADQL